MKRKYVPIRLVPELDSKLRSFAASCGKSVSEFASDLIRSGLEKCSGSGFDLDPETIRNAVESALGNREGSAPGSGTAPEIDRDSIREAVSEAVMDAMKGGEPSVPPEALRFLIQDLAKTENLLRQISRLLSEGKTGDRARDFEEHMERVRMAKQKSARILKNLKLDEIEDVDRIEIKESTPEETAQMLKEMGIETGGEK